MTTTTEPTIGSALRTRVLVINENTRLGINERTTPETLRECSQLAAADGNAYLSELLASLAATFADPDAKAALFAAIKEER